MSKNGIKYLIIYLVCGIAFVVWTLLSIQFGAGLFNKFVLYKSMYVDFGKFNTVGNHAMMSHSIADYFNNMSSKNFSGIATFFGWMLIETCLIAVMAFPKTAAANLIFALSISWFFCLACYLSARLNNYGWGKVAETFFWTLAITILTIVIGSASVGIGVPIVLGLGIMVMYFATSDGDIIWSAFGFGVADIFSVALIVLVIGGFIALLFVDYDWYNIFQFDSESNGQHKKIDFSKLFAFGWWKKRLSKKKNEKNNDLSTVSSTSQQDKEWIDRMNRQHEKELKMSKNATPEEMSIIQSDDPFKDIKLQNLKQKEKAKQANTAIVDEDEKTMAELDKQLIELENKKKELMAKKQKTKGN